MESFQPSGASTHRPLQGKEIRIVTLHPASFDDPVFCTLDHVALDGPRDDYIAISYTWGDPTQTKDINLNGHSYPVTTSLHLALTYLRKKNEPRRLWIDSFCINQRDVAERNAQIPRMRDVYAFAAEVNIWLGDYGSTHKRLAWRPWFQRMWVIQEVAVRNWKEDGKKVKFLVGHLSLTWFILDGACADIVHPQSYLTTWGKRLGEGESYESNGLVQVRTAWEAEHRMRESSMQGVSRTMSQQLGYLLSSFVKFKITDPRDRIYSLLGLLHGSEKVLIDLTPDYFKPVDEVFHAYATWILRTGACIDILSLNSRQHVRRRCPSNPIRILQENRVLEIDALTIGTIHGAGERCDILAKSKTADGHLCSMEYLQNCRQYLLDCEVWIHDHTTDSITSDYSPRNNLNKYFEDSYHTSLLEDHKFIYDDVCRRRYDDIVCDPEQLGRTRRAPISKLDRGQLKWTFKVMWYADFIASQFDGFTPFICDNGKLEFCNSKVDVPEPGDLLCLLRGSSKQYILRRAPPGSLGEWIMVGTTYNAADFRYVDLSKGERSEEEVNSAYTELWTKNADKIFKALIC